MNISDAGAEENDERCDVLPEGTGDTGRATTSGEFAEYISWVYGAETELWYGAKGSYSAERILEAPCDDLGVLICCCVVFTQSLAAVEACMLDLEFKDSSTFDPDIEHE